MLDLVLSDLQSKILIILIIARNVTSLEIIRAVGISASTWNKERVLLCKKGLLNSHVKKELTKVGVTRKYEYNLTMKGKRVAQILLVISSILGGESFVNEKLDNMVHLLVRA